MIATLGSGMPRGRCTGRGIDRRCQPAEVEENDSSDEEPENHQELALLQEIGLAGLVDELGDLEHRPVNGHVLELAIDEQPEQHAEGADEDADHQQLIARDALERDRREVRKAKIGFPAVRSRRSLCLRQQWRSGANRQRRHQTHPQPSPIHTCAHRCLFSITETESAGLKPGGYVLKVAGGL
jgi:hypothetical protein